MSKVPFKTRLEIAKKKASKRDFNNKKHNSSPLGSAFKLSTELVSAVVDLDMCANYKETLFDFDRYRRPEVYKSITSQVGVEIPEGIEVRKEDDENPEG